MVERLEERIPADKLSQVLDLCLVGRDDAEIYAFVENALFAYPGDVGLELFYRKCGFSLVDASETLSDKLLFGLHIFVLTHTMGVS